MSEIRIVKPDAKFWWFPDMDPIWDVWCEAETIELGPIGDGPVGEMTLAFGFGRPFIEGVSKTQLGHRHHGERKEPVLVEVVERVEEHERVVIGRTAVVRIERLKALDLVFVVIGQAL